MEFTTKYFESTDNPVHKELFQLLTGGHPVGKPIKEGKNDDK